MSHRLRCPASRLRLCHNFRRTTPLQEARRRNSFAFKDRFVLTPFEKRDRFDLTNATSMINKRG